MSFIGTTRTDSIIDASYN